MPSGYQRKPVSDAQRLLVLLLLLGVLLIACKGSLLPLPGLNPARAARWAVRLSVVAAADMAYVAILGGVLWTLLKLAGRVSPGRTGWFWLPAWTAVLISALYGAASVPIFRHLEMQLTYPMLHFLAQWREMATSVRAVVSWHTWLGLVSVVGVLVSGYGLATWLWSRRPVRLSRSAVALLLGLAVTYFGFSYYWSQTRWQDRSLWQARLARSPHLRLMESLVVVSPMVDSADFPPEAPEFDDFRPSTRLAEAIAPEPAIGPAKNIVLLVLESVSTRYLGLYGAPYANTPNLERLSEHALVFDNVYSQCPSSAKALVPMLCGVFARTDWREQTRAGQMPVPSLADVVRRQGYRTAFFHSADWRSVGKEAFIKDHGFQHVCDTRHLSLEKLSWGRYDSWLFDEMCRWIDREQTPFLAMAWTIQTHHPYPVEGPERDYGVEDPEMNRYLNSIREADELVGRLWHALEERGLAESTVLAVVGDHGETFGQHNQRLHIFGLYEENVHVPLVIVHNDPRLPVGRRATIGQHVDLPATLAQCAGVPASRDWQGRSLLAAAGRSPRAYFYTVWDPVLFGVRQGRYKYIFEPGHSDALYDLIADPDELDNVVDDHPALRAQLKRRLHALVAFEHQWREGRRPERLAIGQPCDRQTRIATPRTGESIGVVVRSANQTFCSRSEQRLYDRR